MVSDYDDSCFANGQKNRQWTIFSVLNIKRVAKYSVVGYSLQMSFTLLHKRKFEEAKIGARSAIYLWSQLFVVCVQQCQNIHLSLFQAVLADCPVSLLVWPLRHQPPLHHLHPLLRMTSAPSTRVSSLWQPENASSARGYCLGDMSSFSLQVRVTSWYCVRLKCIRFSQYGTK